MKTMKKLYGIICTFLLVAVLTVTSVSTVSAAPKNPTISREGVMVSYIGENYKWAKFRTNDGKVAYCMDVEKKWPEKTTNASASCGISK